MKKLLIATTAIVLAVVTHAASVDWSATKGYLYNGLGDSSAKITSGTAYLMLSTYTQSNLVTAFANAKGDADATISTMQSQTGKYLGTGTIGSTARIKGSGTSDATDSISAYFVVFSGDNMYISATADSSYDATMQEHTISFTTTMTTSSKAVPMSASSGYNGAGWYNVPEPTSAMLLLLGFAGLALKRKNA